MLDAFLDWISVFLPTVLSIGSVLVSIRTPRSKHHRLWYTGLILAGISISGLTFWQQHRARTAHISEVRVLTGQLEKVRSDIATLQQSQQRDQSRREQAEKDLAIIVQATGRATRDGIANDLTQSSKPSPKLIKTRKTLGMLVDVGRSVMDSCNTGPTDKCKEDRQNWEKSVEKTLAGYTDDPSGVARWVTWVAQNQGGVPLPGVQQEALLLSTLIGQLK